MTVLELYNAALDERAEQERSLARAASGDERAHSLHLMQASMLGDMLKVLGRVQHEGRRPDVLQKQIDTLSAEAERLRAQEDFDQADRTLVKMQTIAWAQETLKRLEQEHE